MPVLDQLLSPFLSGDPYLDPGSGSMLLQLILAALLGGAVAVKVFWKKIISIFKRNNNETPDDKGGIGGRDDE